MPRPRTRGVSRIAGCALLGFWAAACGAPIDAPAPPAGGSTVALDFDAFAAEVAPILSRHGCDAGGDCHGGGIRGTLVLSPRGAKDLRFDFEQVAREVREDAPSESPLLTKPLDRNAGGEPHAVEPFSSVDDPEYRAILAWIEGGPA